MIVKGKTRKRPTYRQAVEWVAENDDDSTMDEGTIAAQITVLFVADLFNVPAEQIAAKIVKLRLERDGNEAM